LHRESNDPRERLAGRLRGLRRRRRRRRKVNIIVQLFYYNNNIALLLGARYCLWFTHTLWLVFGTETANIDVRSRWAACYHDLRPDEDDNVG